MVSVSDILKILDQVPIWKKLKELPKRLEDLEARVATLEAKPVGTPCPLCGEPMKVISVAKHPTMGDLGYEEHALACTACPHTQSRTFIPPGS